MSVSKKRISVITRLDLISKMPMKHSTKSMRHTRIKLKPLEQFPSTRVGNLHCHLVFMPAKSEFPAFGPVAAPLMD